MVFRGEQQSSVHSGLIQLPRAQLGLTIILPAGSKPGNYEVQISTELGQRLAAAKGGATLRKDGGAALKVKLDTSKLGKGGYVPGIGKIGNEPYTYPLEVR